tara:strand:+ start:132061 stop:132378 length:318 start_codon:yes stop_codon:yes gene_type:complete
MLAKLFNYKKSIAIIVSLAIYFILTYAVHQQQIAFENELQKLDLNQDGIYTDNEVSPEQKEVIEKVQNSTSDTMAPYTLIPFAAFCGLFTFFGLKMIEKYTLKNN